MATEHVKTNPLNASFRGMMQLPLVHQMGLLVGLTASIALGVYVVLWSNGSDDSVLYHQVSARETGKVMNALIQNARSQRALEDELSRTIMAIATVEHARVHLALPNESEFYAGKHKPSASVFINLVPKRHLNDEQVTAIVNLVASSVPNMETSAVTLVDNKGHLLSRHDTAFGIGLSTRQLEYKHMIESQLASKVENILLPIVGPDKVRAQVVASLDHSLATKRHKPGTIKKLSVAVVVDHKTIRNAKGKLISTAYTQDDLNRFTSLAKEVVGFDATRGDTVNVINEEFSPVPQASLFDQPWGGAAGKQVLGGLLAALFLFGVVRPVMLKLASVPSNRQRRGSVVAGDSQDNDRAMLIDERWQHLPTSNEYESDLEMAKALVVKEPKRVAQVVKQWVNEG